MHALNTNSTIYYLRIVLKTLQMEKYYQYNGGWNGLETKLHIYVLEGTKPDDIEVQTIKNI